MDFALTLGAIIALDVVYIWQAQQGCDGASPTYRVTPLRSGRMRRRTRCLMSTAFSQTPPDLVVKF